ncbi:MAG: response regulator transcription factor [bacterium]|nr:response regulator transcription factor [bacterium]
MKKFRLVIAEDHAVLRDGLRSMLSTIEDIEVVAEACNGLEAIRCVETLVPDLLLLDISMPLLSGLSVVSDVKSRYPEVKIILLTVHESEEYLRETMTKGVEGFCLKKADFSELAEAITTVLKGATYISPLLQLEPGMTGSRPAADSDSVPATSWQLLTQREKDVLKLVGEGYRNKEIGALLYISPKTVEKHRSNLMKKLDLHNASALTTYAIKQGLVIPKA